MRMHIKLDENDPPEFDSFASLLVALKGAAWSLSNSYLGELVSDADQERLFALMGEMTTILNRLRDSTPDTADDTSMDVVPPTTYHLLRYTISTALSNEEPVAELTFLDIPREGQERSVKLDPRMALRVAMDLLGFVEQASNGRS